MGQHDTINDYIAGAIGGTLYTVTLVFNEILNPVCVFKTIKCENARNLLFVLTSHLTQ